MLFDSVDFDEHEHVVFCSDQATGLRAIIAIHSSALGPAAGGCRMYPYGTEEAALADVLRLSKGMSYKNALANLPLGGGKSVIIADPARPDKPELLRAFGHHVQSLAGRYWTAIDVGVGPADADILAETCDYTFARASQYGHLPLGDRNPSVFTARGGFNGIRASVAHLHGSDDLSGVRVAIQGVGATGSRLAQHLHDAGAKLVVADVDEETVATVVERFGAEAVSVDDIHAQDVDVFAPCALGAVLNDTTIPELKASIVCGLANNQLADAHHGADLKKRAILYAPDYVVNAGGVMGAATTIYDPAQDPASKDAPSREAALVTIDKIYDTLITIFSRADETSRSTSAIADEMAEARITSAKKGSGK